MEFWAAFSAVAALGTGGAILIALYQIGAERTARRADRDRALSVERAQQARRVSAWPVPGPAALRVGLTAE